MHMSVSIPDDERRFRPGSMTESGREIHRAHPSEKPQQRWVIFPEHDWPPTDEREACLIGGFVRAGALFGREYTDKPSAWSQMF